MRPTKQETDLEFWAKAKEYWAKKEEEWFLLDDREGEERARQMLFRAELAHQEARGEIVVYSGRAKPRWA